MKSFLLLTLLLSSTPSYAVDLTTCSDEIQEGVANVVTMVSDLDDEDLYSDEMLNILSHSITGMVVAAPACDALKGIEYYYRVALGDLRKK